jgi:nucleotide-binding universal stress UspA family protein
VASKNYLVPVNFSKALKRLLLGSVAEKTLRYAECPVLIVKK